MCQFGLTFFPSKITVTPFGTAIKEASKLPPATKNLSRGNVPGGLYPWSWDGDSDSASFDAYKNRLFVPPILTKLILDREPDAVKGWVERVTRFPFMRIIPCHLDNDIKATGKDFALAFAFLDSDAKTTKTAARPLKDDLRLLQTASDKLTDLGVVEPTKVKSSPH